jgi:hypothetical protein
MLVYAASCYVPFSFLQFNINYRHYSNIKITEQTMLPMLSGAVRWYEMFILKFQAPRRHKSRYPATRPVVYASVKCEIVLKILLESLSPFRHIPYL